ncbi:MAG TPA: IS110 family transposase [Mycobacteriales bacterium]|nr:IS110 family transposase [Mycobacteriales bacterium]
MDHANGLSRGDRNRNSRLSRLRQLVPAANAITAIDLAGEKQMLVVTDHDSRVLARRTFKLPAWQLGAALDWAGERATAAGFPAVTVSCEPTGHRWRVVGQLAADRSMPFVCVQPLLVARSRENENYSPDKTDDRDAVLIARLTAELRCYAPEATDEVWARLRHLGARRARLCDETSSLQQQMRDLLECAWPAMLDTAAKQFKAKTWCAALAVVTGRCNGDPTRLRRLGLVRFSAAVRREMPRWQGQRPCRRIVEAAFAALADTTGVTVQRRGILERVGLVLDDWRDLHRRIDDTETRMVAVLDELGLTELVTSIQGVSAVNAAAILAESGDLHRFATGRALVKHSGLAPAEQTSGKLVGRTRLTGRGRPGLRTAAWRAAWGAMKSNTVYQARYAHLTTREQGKLKPGQARCAIAAALLRQLHAVVTTGRAWSADIAANGTRMTLAA